MHAGLTCLLVGVVSAGFDMVSAEFPKPFPFPTPFDFRRLGKKYGEEECFFECSLNSIYSSRA